MTEEMVKYLLGGACGAMALVITALWRLLWKKDAEIDTVREAEIAKREVAVAAREKIIDDQRKVIDDTRKELYELKVDFEKQHGNTVRKALSIVMAAKHKRPPRHPSLDTRDATTQMKLLTQELGDINPEDLLKEMRG